MYTILTISKSELCIRITHEFAAIREVKTRDNRKLNLTLQPWVMSENPWIMPENPWVRKCWIKFNHAPFKINTYKISSQLLSW